MNIVLDAMPIGAAYESSTGKTGVFRVADQLIRGLDRDQRCTLSLIATTRHKQTRAYFEENENYHQRLRYPTTTDRLIEKGRRTINAPDIWRKLGPSTNLEKLVRSSDIYHSPYSPIPGIAKTGKAKAFLTVHDLIPIMQPQYFKEEGIPFVRVAVESILPEGWAFCVSESTKNDLCNSFPIDPERVFVTHLAASRYLFYKLKSSDKIREVQAKYAIPPEPYFLSLCTFEPRKNIDQTIRSFINFIEQQHISDLNLVLIGTKGWNYEKIFQEITDSGTYRSRIFVTGFVNDEDLVYLYNGARAFVYPSFYEGFGLPPLEAMQCGTPVITSNTSSLPEVVGDAGIMINPHDGDALCDAMYKLFNDTELATELSRKSIMQAAKFSWDNFIQRTVEGYEKVV